MCKKDIYGQFEKTFMMYLPRLCEHRLNWRACRSHPSGAIYKREEDGIVLIDQDKCRVGVCVSACPYKKSITTGRAENLKNVFSGYPRIEMGEPTVCSELAWTHTLFRCDAVWTPIVLSRRQPCRQKKDLYQAHLDIFFSIRMTRKCKPRARRCSEKAGWSGKNIAGL